MKLILFSLFALAAVQLPQTQPPALLEQALKTEPGIRLLVPATDLREYSQDQLQKFGYWPPWLEGDFDRDMRPDVMAVVVKPAPGGSEFGIIAVHARAPKEVQWVVPLDVDPINGIAKGPAADTVIPLFCVECDANAWFRWSGEEYEAELYAVGEKIDIGSETQADLPLYSSANLASKPVTSVAHCTTVTVRKVAGTPDERWYFVETPEGQRGWVSDKVTGADICVG
jgi:hypothetical protein